MKKSVVAICLLVSTQCYAVNQEKVSFLAGLPKPPFIMTQNGKGLQLDIIRKALSTQNISATFFHAPLSRSVLNFQQTNIDAISIVLPDYTHPNMFVSKPYITYKNVAVSLIERELKIESLSDLEGLSVTAFQRAKKHLGEEYNFKVSRTSGYREVANQREQIDTLFTGQAEVIILDINIFMYFCRRHKEAMYQNPFKIHKIFGEQSYSAGFKSKAQRDKFDLGIAKIKENGLYDKILATYL